MIGFICTCLQLQSIETAHNQWLLATHSIPYWTTSVLSSTVTNDESFTNKSSELLEPTRIHGNPCKLFIVMKTLATKQPRLYCWLRYLENVFTETLPSKWSYVSHTFYMFRRYHNPQADSMRMLKIVWSFPLCSFSIPLLLATFRTIDFPQHPPKFYVLPLQSSIQHSNRIYWTLTERNYK
jgi:hypothetical protein